MLGAWSWWTCIRRSPTPANQGRVGLTFLAGALTLWYPLAGWHQAYFLVSANFFGMMWAFLPFGWAVAGNVVLIFLILLRSLVTAGQPLSSLLGWPLLSGALGLGWAALLAMWMRSVMQESQKRQRLIEELEATRLSLAQAERQAGVLAERQRMAREIHDTLAQDFTSIVLHLEAADAALPVGAEPLRMHVSRARETARGGLREARRLVLALRPEPLADASLPEALHRVAAHWTQETGVPAAVCPAIFPVASADGSSTAISVAIAVGPISAPISACWSAASSAAGSCSCVPPLQAARARMSRANKTIILLLISFMPKLLGSLLGGGDGLLGEAFLLHLLPIQSRLSVSRARPGGLNETGQDRPVIAKIASRCACLLYTSPSPRDRTRSRMPSSA